MSTKSLSKKRFGSSSLFTTDWWWPFFDYGLYNYFSASKPTSPKMNVYMDGSDLVFEAVVPGMTKEDITVEIYDGVLTINGKVSKNNNSNNSMYINEFDSFSFSRSFVLPETIGDDFDNIKAKLDRGILEVRLKGVDEGKSKKTEPKVIPVE